MPEEYCSSAYGCSRFVAHNFLCFVLLSIDPSASQLPTVAASRGNLKHPRIQLLDIQQGNEIMQSMNDARIRKEQGWYRYNLLPLMGVS